MGRCQPPKTKTTQDPSLRWFSSTATPAPSRAPGWVFRSVELLFFGRTGQGLHAGRTALNNGGHVVEVACAHFLLVRHEGVAFVACCEFRLLHHFNVVLHAFAASVCVGELEGVVQSVDTVSARFLTVFCVFRVSFPGPPTHAPLCHGMPFQTDKPLCASPRLRCPFTPHHPPTPPKWALDGGMGEFWTCLNFSQAWAAPGACQLASTTLAATSTAENKVSSAKWL